MKSGNNRFAQYINGKKASKGANFTHTRIGGSQIYGGTYQISDTESALFLEKYYQHVFVDGNKEYLTEKQILDDGPVLIDIDLRYEKNVTTKQHTKDHIVDLIMVYAEKCSMILNIEENAEIDVFVMEKKNVNQLENKTKDGIHIIMGIAMHKAAQLFMREKVLEEIGSLWDDLPITNTWEDVLDEGVTKGFVNWQLYGSRKPENQAYMIKSHYILTHDDGWDIRENDIAKFDTRKYLPKLSARCRSHPKYDTCEDLKRIIEDYKGNLGRKMKHVVKTNKLTRRP